MPQQLVGLDMKAVQPKVILVYPKKPSYFFGNFKFVSHPIVKHGKMVVNEIQKLLTNQDTENNFSQC